MQAMVQAAKKHSPGSRRAASRSSSRRSRWAAGPAAPRRRGTRLGKCGCRAGGSRWAAGWSARRRRETEGYRMRGWVSQKRTQGSWVSTQRHPSAVGGSCQAALGRGPHHDGGGAEGARLLDEGREIGNGLQGEEGAGRRAFMPAGPSGGSTWPPGSGGACAASPACPAAEPTGPQRLAMKRLPSWGVCLLCWKKSVPQQKPMMVLCSLRQKGGGMKVLRTVADTRGNGGAGATRRSSSQQPRIRAERRPPPLTGG